MCGIPPPHMNPYLVSEEDSDDSELGDSVLMRSFSIPVPNANCFEDKLEPHPLERQPFSNLINLHRPSNNFANPLEKVDLKQAFKEDHPHAYHPTRFPERNFAEDSFGIIDDENICTYAQAVNPYQ